MKVSIPQKLTSSLVLVLSLSLSLSLGTIMSSNLYAQDQKDSRWTAKQILTHYKAKDWKALSAYTTGGNKKMIDAIANNDKSSRLKSIVSGWRWDKISAWDGKISEVRAGPRGAMFAKFAEQGKECFLVKMSKQENKWYFDDIKSPDCTTFNKYKTL